MNTRDFPDSFVLLELYGLYFEIMDYLLVQNVFVTENIFGYRNLRKAFLYLKDKIVNCFFQSRILISLTH